MRYFSCDIVKSSYNLIENEVEITSALRKKMEEKTGTKWGLWPWLNAWDLVKDFNNKSHRIGIESSFSVNEMFEPEYRIYITVWERKNWKPYEEELKKEFAEAYNYKFDDSQGDRIYLHIPPVKLVGDEDDWFARIVYKLYNVYKKMEGITARIK